MQDGTSYLRHPLFQPISPESPVAFKGKVRLVVQPGEGHPFYIRYDLDFPWNSAYSASGAPCPQPGSSGGLHVPWKGVYFEAVPENCRAIGSTLDAGMTSGISPRENLIGTFYIENHMML